MTKSMTQIVVIRPYCESDRIVKMGRVAHLTFSGICAALATAGSSVAALLTEGGIRLPRFGQQS